MPSKELWPLIQAAMQAFNPHYRESIQQVFADFELEGADWFYSYLAYGLEPEALTAVALHQMTPYANINNQAERLAQTAERGYLETIEKDTYRLADAGRKVVNAFFASAGGAIAPLEPLPAAKMTRLADLLGRVIAAAATADPPAVKTHFRICRRTDPGPDASASSRIDQYLTDLLRYRDDAHLAAWADLGVDGRTWDAFTNIWREQAVTAPALAEALANRNYTEEDYAASLSTLVKRGWIEKANGAYQATETGRRVREEAEKTTERYFFTGWSALSEAEAADLEKLLTKLRDGLREMAADKATAAANDLWPLAGKISGLLFKLTRPAMDPLFAEMELAERGLAFGLLQAATFDPDPVTGPGIGKRFPYASPKNWVGSFNKLAEKGLLRAANEGEYVLTEDGRSALARFLNAFRQRLDTLTLAVDLERLAELLGRIIAACLNAPEPPGTWAVRRSRALAPDDDAPALAKIDQFFDDLNAFRDDAHLAAFAPHEMSGHGWELFSHLWRGKVKSAADMAEQMAFRGHDEAAYAAALADLETRGWVASSGDGAKLTDKGREVREAAETQTDRYFYLPWLTLSRTETAELRELMTALNDQLEKLVESEPVPA